MTTNAAVTARLYSVLFGEPVAHPPAEAPVPEGGMLRFAVPETLARTTVGAWRPGTKVNLERALAVGERLGGHLVQGHVDAVGEILQRRPEGQGARLVVSLPAAIAPLVAEKGSIAVDGVSLTVAAVSRDRFEIALIPETLARTTLGARQVGDRVNLEADVLAKHVEKLLGGRAASAGEHVETQSGVSK